MGDPNFNEVAENKFTQEEADIYSMLQSGWGYKAGCRGDDLLVLQKEVAAFVEKLTADDFDDEKICDVLISSGSLEIWGAVARHPNLPVTLYMPLVERGQLAGIAVREDAPQDVLEKILLDRYSCCSDAVKHVCSFDDFIQVGFEGDPDYITAARQTFIKKIQENTPDSGGSPSP